MTSFILLKFLKKTSYYKQQYLKLLATQNVDSFLSFASDNLVKENKSMSVVQHMDKEKNKEI